MKHPTLLIIAVLIPYFLAHIFFTHLIDIHDSYPAKFSSRMILLEEARQNPLIVREHAPNFHRKKFSCQKCVLNVSIRKQKIHNRLNFNAANKSLVANTKSIVTIAKNLQFRYGHVYFMLINHAYLELALNWLCNTDSKQSLSQNKTKLKSTLSANTIHNMLLLVTLDENTCSEIQKQWKEVKCLSLEIEDRNMRTLLNNALVPGMIEFSQLLGIRIIIATELAKAGIRFVLIEPDSIWLHYQPQQISKSDVKADFVLTETTPPNFKRLGNSDSSKLQTTGKFRTFSPILILPKNTTINALLELQKRLYNGSGLLDQDILNDLCEHKFSDILCKKFPSKNFADGSWLKLSDKERYRAAASAGQWPMIVDNNFYSGMQEKIARQKINGFWFLSATTNKCNPVKVRRTLSRYKIASQPKIIGVK